jgi:hypothetical protein
MKVQAQYGVLAVTMRMAFEVKPQAKEIQI